MSQERSAEFYRGALWHWGTGCNRADIVELLAEAEAREASVPTAAEVIAAAERALQDCRRVVNIVCNDHEYSAPGDAEAMAKANDTITLIEKWKEVHNA